MSLHKLSDEAQVEAAIANVLAYLGAYERLCMAGEVAEHVEWASGEWTRVFESEPGDEQDALLTNIHAQLDERGVGQAVEAVA